MLFLYIFKGFNYFVVSTPYYCRIIKMFGKKRFIIINVFKRANINAVGIVYINVFTVTVTVITGNFVISVKNIAILITGIINFTKRLFIKKF